MSQAQVKLEDTATPDEAPETEARPAPIPSWFAEKRHDNDSDPLVQYRKRLEERMAAERQREWQQAAATPHSQPAPSAHPQQVSHAHGLQAPYPHHDYAQAPRMRAPRPTLPADEIAGRSARYALEQDEFEYDDRPRRPWAMIMALGLTAAIVGGGLGYGFSQRTALLQAVNAGSTKAKNLMADLSKPLPETQSTPASGVTMIVSKPIAMAALQVNDAHGALGSPIPLSLDAKLMGEGPAVDVLISGLPPAATLSAGKPLDAGKWLVNAHDMAGLKLTVPQSDKPQLDLEVAAIAPGTDELAAPAQKLRVALDGVTIAPVSAAPDEAGSNTVAQPAAIPEPVKGADLVAKADALLLQGDILSARQIYLQAAGMGNGKAMMGVAKTYDPKIFAVLKVEGIQPDAAKAEDWYKKAKAAGVASN